jgi:hypothetical protein
MILYGLIAVALGFIADLVILLYAWKNNKMFLSSVLYNTSLVLDMAGIVLIALGIGKLVLKVL